MCPTRRRFLKAILHGSAAALAAPLFAQEARPLPFAFSLYGMRTLSLDDALAACSRIGYDAVELALMANYPAEPSRLSRDDRRRLRDRLAELRLSLPLLMENLPLDGADGVQQRTLDRLQAAFELGRDLVPDRPPIVETILGGPVDAWERLRQTFVDRLRTWAGVAERHRTTIAVKPHRMNAMNRPEHATWLMEQVNSPWIKIGYDYSHFQHRDLTIEATLQTLLPQTRFVHVKDTRIVEGRAQFVLPGDGSVDYAALFRRLREANYSGCVCVEVSGMVQNQPGYDPVAAAQRSFDNLAPALVRAGLRNR
jgi:inosose dehydratase